jgi:hypothetical protein
MAMARTSMPSGGVIVPRHDGQNRQTGQAVIPTAGPRD